MTTWRCLWRWKPAVRCCASNHAHAAEKHQTNKLCDLSKQFPKPTTSQDCVVLLRFLPGVHTLRCMPLDSPNPFDDVGLAERIEFPCSLLAMYELGRAQLVAYPQRNDCQEYLRLIPPIRLTLVVPIVARTRVKWRNNRTDEPQREHCGSKPGNMAYVIHQQHSII